jgi:hypothetical protein
MPLIAKTQMAKLPPAIASSLVPYEPTLLTCCVELHRPLNPIKS